ncbi:MAG: hypothetical protein ACTS73_04020 [Arsenophonus sp. NEOnobi-MAG3]
MICHEKSTIQISAKLDIIPYHLHEFIRNSARQLGDNPAPF